MTAPQLCLADDVPETFAAFAVAAQRRADGLLRYASSGGTAGRACMEALARSPIDWSGVDLFLVDERCVPEDSPDRNSRSLSEALGAQRDKLSAFHEMDCTAGPDDYEEQLRSAGRLDLVQLGLGPDGHTASIFPGSPALDAPAGRLVVRNVDPSGLNPHERMTLTFGAIAAARLAVVTAIGAAKHDVLARLCAGEDLPAGRLQAMRLVWLVDAAAAGDLPTTTVPDDLLAGAAS